MKVLKSIAAIIAAFGVIMSAPVSAQNNFGSSNYQKLREASIEVYNSCLAVGGAEANSAICACVAGYLGGAMNDREYEIMGRLSKIGTLSAEGASEAEIQAEIQAFFAAGFTPAEADAVSAKMNSMTARGDMICAPYATSAIS